MYQMKSDSSTLAVRLKSAREEKHLTQAELAEAIGSHANVIWQYENNKRIPTLDNGSKLSKVLQVDLNYLLGLSNTNDFESAALSSQELLIEIRKFFKNNNVAQKNKDTFYHNVTNDYWKTKQTKGGTV